MSIDKSLSFGMQNWFFCKSDETDGTYNYYLYTTKKGSSLIMRTNKTISDAKYFCASGDIDAIWSSRSSKTYVYPDALVDPTV